MLNLTGAGGAFCALLYELLLHLKDTLLNS